MELKEFHGLSTISLTGFREMEGPNFCSMFFHLEDFFGSRDKFGKHFFVVKSKFFKFF